MRTLLAAAGVVLAVCIGGCAAEAPPAAPASPAVVHTIGAMPVSVEIPAIGVKSTTPLVPLGLDAQGHLESPPVAHPEVGGWFEPGVRPGDVGPAVLAAHVNGHGKPGLFVRLRELKPGDAVRVTREDRSIVVYRVSRVEAHDKDAFPTQAVYGDTPGATIRLITCGGTFNRVARSYEDNVVAFGVLDHVEGV